MPGKIRFGVYELDRDAMELRKRGVLLRLQEQPLRVLAMLAERPGEVITREQLQEQIWGNTFDHPDHDLPGTSGMAPHAAEPLAHASTSSEIPEPARISWVRAVNSSKAAGLKPV